MPRITVTVWRCGQCGKPRGLHHLCTGRRKGRDRIGLTVSLACPKCGARALNLLTHTCAPKSDFRQRAAAAERRERNERRRQKRRAAAARKRARQKERKKQAAERRRQLRAEAAAARRRRERSQSHDRSRHEYAECADEFCGKYQCRVYRDGLEAGRAEGQAAGYAAGYAEGATAALQDS